MARKKGMIGSGAKKMGGIGAKPAAPRTAMAGRPPMGLGAPGGMLGGGGMGGGGMGGGGMGGMGGGVPRPPAGAGMPPPTMGATPRPPMGGGRGGGIGGSPGFNKGGRIEKGELKEVAEAGLEKDHKIKEGQRFARGGAVNHEKEHHEKEHHEKEHHEKEHHEKEYKKYAKGGSVSKSDAKPRVARVGSFR